MLPWWFQGDVVAKSLPRASDRGSLFRFILRNLPGIGKRKMIAAASHPSKELSGLRISSCLHGCMFAIERAVTRWSRRSPLLQEAFEMHPLTHIPVLRIAVFFLVVAGSRYRTPAQEGGDPGALQPYSVFVTQDETFARCGPSKEYYRTDPLRRGQQLEVYVETQDDWLGVRPPEESFCWVPASTVELEDGHQRGEVIEDKTVAWIGTHLGRARRYRWQVQLAEGEAVTVIGRSERDGPDGPQLWYRIVPPSGEFRWIHRDMTVESAEELLASVEQSPDDVDTVDGEERNVPAEVASSERDQERENNAPRVNQVSRLDGDNANRSFDIRSSRRTLPAERTSTPNLQTASARSGRSVLETPQDVSPARSNDDLAGSVVGSGLRRPWQAPSVTGGASGQSSAGAANDSAATDGSWASHTDQGNALTGKPTASAAVEQASGEMSAQSSRSRAASSQVAHAYNTSAPSGGSQVKPLSPETSAAAKKIAAEVQNADVGQMQLVLSRLMAEQASAAEAEPVISAARRLAASTSDELTSVRAELLAQRARQYSQVAQRRDGAFHTSRAASAVLPAAAESSVTAAGESTASSLVPSVDPGAGGGGVPSNSGSQGAAGTGAFVESGFLVQVYSARPNSPPFALTDNTGRTVAYVTPSPGVNLRIHLNSDIRVAGNQGFLRGLNTPHILVTRAVRTEPN